jgi:glutathione synthase/RimK-type ligase-like ATP-grasp enzyme
MLDNWLARFYMHPKHIDIRTDTAIRSSESLQQTGARTRISQPPILECTKTSIENLERAHLARKVFTRDATGLVRDLSGFDAFNVNMGLQLCISLHGHLGY